MLRMKIYTTKVQDGFIPLVKNSQVKLAFVNFYVNK